jgi:polyhydroxybutyrate depolymerase
MSSTPIRCITVIALSLAACGDGSNESADAAVTPSMDGAPDAAHGDAGPDEALFGGVRPAQVLVPPGYDPQTPTPLVVALHGYSTNTTYVAAVLGLDPLYKTAGFLLVSPQGTKDPEGQYFWNATDACCNKFGAPVDDVAYLNGLVDEISGVYNVDPKRIYVVGHSNGGFMAYRLACTSANRFAAIVSVAGATFADVAACTPDAPVHVLQIHGTSDATIHYDGGTLQVQNVDVPYPGAVGSVERWAGYNGCATTTTGQAAKDLTGTADAETDPVTYDGCPAGGDVDLWTVNGAGHLIFFKSGEPVWNWLEGHAKP